MAGAGEAAAAAALPFLVHDVAGEYSIASGQLANTTMELLVDHRCLETPQGWVLALHRASRRTFLWRPQDGHRIALPPMATGLPRKCKCLLTHKLSDKPSAADACFVVVFDLASPHYWFCHVRGHPWFAKWKHSRYTLPRLNSEGRPLVQDLGIAAVGGKIYQQLSRHELGVLEFDPVHTEPTLTRIEVDAVRVPRGSLVSTSYLVESCDELFLVVVYFRVDTLQEIARVALYKMDFSTPAWRKADRIGDRVFLLGGVRGGFSNFGASCPASKHGLAAGCIYFFNHIFFQENKIHVFNVTSGTEEVRCIFQEFNNAFRSPFWILPTEDPYTIGLLGLAKWFFTSGQRLLSSYTDFLK
ncbi:hypothetical protein ACP4OV_015855 [Aristida adscensionis]